MDSPGTCPGKKELKTFQDRPLTLSRFDSSSVTRTVPQTAEAARPSPRIPFRGGLRAALQLLERWKQPHGFSNAISRSGRRCEDVQTFGLIAPTFYENIWPAAHTDFTAWRD
jgi:hypothetical protein